MNHFVSTLLVFTFGISLTSAEAVVPIQCAASNPDIRYEGLDADDLTQELQIYRSGAQGLRQAQDRAKLTLWDIYEKSFPSNERVEPERFVRNYREEQSSSIFVKMLKANLTVGFFHLIFLKESPFTFLSYIAIAEQERRRGLGGQLLECVKLISVQRQSQITRSFMGILLELDRAPPDELANANSLIYFYRKHGGMVVDKEYEQPPLRSEEPWVPMWLEFIPYRDIIPDFPPEKFGVTARNILYKEIYGVGTRRPAKDLSKR